MGFRVCEFGGKEAKWPPMVSQFLLHDPSDMGIKSVSGQGKLSVWGRMLEWHCRCQEAFSTLEGLLGRNGRLQRFGPCLQEIS
jgi:hypothetical protein